MSDLFQHLTPHTTIITPNSRLTAVFNKHYAQMQCVAGKNSWLSPDILSIKAWLQRTWLQYTAAHIEATPLLLSATQEQVLWEEILRRAPESAYILQMTKTAELAQTAWSTLKQWCVDFNNPDLSSTEDSAIFQTWAREFNQQLQHHQWLDANSIPQQLILLLQQKKLTVPSHLLLAGFTELTPQYDALFAAYAEAGCQISHYTPPNRNQVLQRLSLTDAETEITSMARWAKALYERDNQTTICCVVPQLEKLREDILTTFCAVFSPANTFITDHTKLPFNISAGKSLTHYPLIHMALQLLNLGKEKIKIETLCQLLRSPFLAGSDTEMFMRAQLENTLREQNVNQISLAALCERAEISTCPILLKVLRASLAALPDATQLAPISHWVTLFTQKLTLLGWPGERSLDSAEFQTGNRWLKVLAEYATYEATLGSLNYAQALHYLTYLTHIIIFQPESPEARIQILGTLEAADIPFDYLWVMGMDDSVWPPSPKPNPFIPQRLQKALQMPHATAERELIFTRQLTQQLQRSAKTVIFSHALQLEDAELRPSPLIIEMPKIALEQLELAAFTSPAQQIFATQDLEIFTDAIAPVIQEHEIIRGGTRIFKDQAACPFKAFAEIRLHANKQEITSPGLRAKDRGSLLHKALEIIWLDLKDQEALLALSASELQQLIQTAVTTALNKFSALKSSNRRYLELEAKRLQNVITRWLQLEKQRPPFKIKALEEKHEVTWGRFPLRIMADRIDELESGKQIIIDYKSGKTNPKEDWFSERPKEPQLPLYCVLGDDNTIGILFAQVNAEEMGWKGESGMDLKIRGVKENPDWEKQIENWRSVLKKLGEDFYHGQAQVQPKNGAKTCEYCHLPTLCRIDEIIEVEKS